MAPALPLLPNTAAAPAGPPAAAPDSHPILVLRPGRFEDGQLAIEAVRAGRSVVLNASELDPALGQRLVDFTCGGIAAMDGQAHRLGEAVFLFAPSMARVEADEPAL